MWNNHKQSSNGKIMRSGILVSVAVIILILAYAKAPADKQVNAGCKDLENIGVVRIDENGKRVFIHMQSEQIATMKKARSILSAVQDAVVKCRSSWGNTWSVSFFTEPKYAGNKDKQQLLDSISNSNWAQSYIGEYDRQSYKLTLNPSNPQKLKSFMAVLP